MVLKYFKKRRQEVSENQAARNREARARAEDADLSSIFGAVRESAGAAVPEVPEPEEAVEEEAVEEAAEGAKAEEVTEEEAAEQIEAAGASAAEPCA